MMLEIQAATADTVEIRTIGHKPYVMIEADFSRIDDRDGSPHVTLLTGGGVPQDDAAGVAEVLRMVAETLTSGTAVDG